MKSWLRARPRYVTLARAKSELLPLCALAVGLASCDDYSSARARNDGGSGALAGSMTSGAAGSAGTSLGAGGNTALAGGPSAGAGSIDATGALPASAKCDAAAPEEPALVMQMPAPTDEDFLNPERGFHADMPLPQAALDDYRSKGSSLLRSYVILGAYRDQALPQDFLDGLSYSLDLARDRGLKVVLRFAYNDDGTEDAPLQSVLQHIGQLGPIIQKQADVIALLQAGFIGRWGEWHHSQHGLNTGDNRKTILDALLGVVPASLMVQMRYPWQRKQIFPDALSENNAFSGMGAARVGHHNDCFLTSNNDLGTYGDFVDEATGSAPDDQVIRWMSYVAQESRFTVTGGETCQNTERSSCVHALSELARFHYSYLNSAYIAEVNQRWVDEGCMPEVRRRLGYRLSLEHVSYNDHVAPGGVLRVALSLKNQGFAAPYNERPVYLVLDGAARIFAKLSFDPRTFLPEKGPLQLGAFVRVPASLAAGQYRLALWLPDAAEALQGRPEYALRLANTDVWNAAAGDNTLGNVTVDPSTPGCVDHAATELTELPQ